MRSMRGLFLVLAVPLSFGTALAFSQAAADEMTRLAQSNNAFGLDLYGRVAGAPGNVVVSPASISTGLAMPWGGARGETAVEMQRVLRFEGEPAAVMAAGGKLSAALQDPSQPLVLRIANRLFGEQTFHLEPPFIEATRSVFGAPLEPVDFKRAPDHARHTINGWVEAQTEQRIRELIPPGGVTGETRLVLVNAIYFLADWDEAFDKRATRPAPFHLSKTESKDVPTMRREAIVRFAKFEGFRALELPYKGGKFSMMLVLPEGVDGLPVIEQSLTEPRLDGIVQRLAPVRVAVALPSFELNPSIRLGGILKGMGIRSAFDANRADFTGIANPLNGGERLFLGEVFHKAFVRVDEKGTEAAAATGGVMMLARARPRAEAFTADHTPTC